MPKTRTPARKPAGPAAPAAGSAASPAPDDLRGTLLKRLAVAGLLISLLLGTLAIFDHLAAPPEEEELPAFSKPIPVAPRKEVSQPVKQTSELPPPPEAAKPADESASPASASPARETAGPASEQLPPPRVEARPSLDSGKNAPAPASTVSGPAKPAPRQTEAVGVRLPAPAATATPRPAPAPAPSPVPEETASPPLLPPSAASESVAAKPSARVLETRQASSSSPAGTASRAPEPPRLFSGFSLQAGVFANPQLAEELHARLTLSGVPSTLETRVQVGPFRTRQEAEAAQAKLRGLGIETVLTPPRGARR